MIRVIQSSGRFWGALNGKKNMKVPGKLILVNLRSALPSEDMDSKFITSSKESY